MILAILMLPFITMAIWNVNAAIIGPERRPMESKSMTAAYFREHKHLVTYETTAKVLFTMGLPHINATDPGECDPDDVQCFARKTAYNGKLEMDDFAHQMSKGKSRRKRQVSLIVAGVAGYLLNTIFSKFTKKIFGTDEEASDLINQYRDYLISNSQEHLYFNASVERLAKGVQEIASRHWFFDRKVDRRDKALLFLSQVHVAALNYQLGIERCVNRRIPLQFVSSKILKTQLHLVEESIAKQGYRLTIPLTNLDEYYKVSLCDCMFSNTSAYIMVNIPVEKLEWKVYDFIPVSFAFKNQTCALKASDNLIAVSKSRVEVIDPKLSPFCDTVHDSLCYVPSFSFHAQTCAQKIYSGTTLDDIMTTCDMNCRNNSLLQVVNVDRGVVVVTNGKSLKVECKDRSLEYTLSSRGATEIFVKCSCSYNIDGDNIDLQMCDIGSFSDSDVKHMIPNFSPVTVFSDDSNNLNYTVPDYLTHILPNKSSYPPLVIPSPDMSTIHYRDVWLIAVSVVQVVFFAGCIILCIWLSKK